MVGTESFLVYRQRPLIKRLSLCVATPVLVKPSQVVERCRNICVIGTQSFLIDRQRPLIQRLGLVRSGLEPGRAPPGCSAITQRPDDRDRKPFRISPATAYTAARPLRSDLGLGKAQPSCSAMAQHPDDRDRKLFRLLPATACRAARRRHSTLSLVSQRQVVQRYRNSWVIGTKRFFSCRQRALVEWLGLCIANLDLVKLRQVVHHSRNIWVIGSEGLSPVSPTTACTEARHLRSDLGLRKAQLDCSAPVQHLGCRDRAPSPVSPTTACTAARHRRNDLEFCKARPNCSARSQHRGDRDRELSPVSPTTACAEARHLRSERRRLVQPLRQTRTRYEQNEAKQRRRNDVA